MRRHPRGGRRARRDGRHEGRRGSRPDRFVAQDRPANLARRAGRHGRGGPEARIRRGRRQARVAVHRPVGLGCGWPCGRGERGHVQRPAGDAADIGIDVPLSIVLATRRAEEQRHGHAEPAQGRFPTHGSRPSRRVARNIWDSTVLRFLSDVAKVPIRVRRRDCFMRVVAAPRQRRGRGGKRTIGTAFPDCRRLKMPPLARYSVGSLPADGGRPALPLVAAVTKSSPPMRQRGFSRQTLGWRCFSSLRCPPGEWQRLTARRQEVGLPLMPWALDSHHPLADHTCWLIWR